jgi:copper chaperone
MKQTFSIQGMTCDHCAGRVEKAVTELPGIKKVKIHLKKNNGVVKFDESEEIAKKITDTGYEASII